METFPVHNNQSVCVRVYQQTAAGQQQNIIRARTMTRHQPLPLPRLHHTMCRVSTLDIYTSFVTVKVKVKDDLLNTTLTPWTGARGLAGPLD